MTGTFRLLRIAGIDIGVHYTWIIAFALITWSIAVGFLPDILHGYDPVVYWSIAALSAILLFASVLVHELAHSLTARAKGTPVSSITLFIFGGVSNLQAEPRSARDELLIAIVGPASSAAIAVVCGLILLIGRGVLGLFGVVLTYLAMVNAILAVFNMLPGFPLDGGRVFRAIVWALTGSVEKATRVAAAAGHVLAFAFIGIGIVQMLTGSFFGGLWTVFIGWFLNGAAESSRAAAMHQDMLRGVRVSDLMDPEPETVSPDMMIDELVREELIRRGRPAMPVCDGERLAGIITLSDVKELAPERWPTVRVGQIMTREPLYTVTPADEMSKALQLLAEHDLNQLPVMEDSRLVGLLSRSNIISYMQFRQQLRLGEPRLATGKER